MEKSFAELASELVPEAPESKESKFTPEEMVVVERLIREFRFIETKTYYPARLSTLSRNFSKIIKKVSPKDTPMTFMQRMEEEGLCSIEIVPSNRFKMVYSREMMDEVRKNGSVLQHLGGFERQLASMKEGVQDPITL